jgi:hypothetical protein
MKTLKNLVESWLRSALQASYQFAFAVAMMLCVLLMPSLAYADTAISSATQEILNILIPVFVALIGALATWILRKVQQKLHIDVGEKTAAAWAELARKAALRGGEWARKKSKEMTDGKKVPGGEVMEVAASWAVEMAKQQKLPEMARNKLEGLIEAHLFELRSAEEEVAATPPAV